MLTVAQAMLDSDNVIWLIKKPVIQLNRLSWIVPYPVSFLELLCSTNPNIDYI
jgi:hypothetical protein